MREKEDLIPSPSFLPRHSNHIHVYPNSSSPLCFFNGASYRKKSPSPHFPRTSTVNKSAGKPSYIHLIRRNLSQISVVLFVIRIQVYMTS
ncbi:hypothetical protein L6452_38623 [Arctium lappa]|uniref:Uncharacterized protein n=1 Tax=Arctium lappa TaxID=4217 RepID=A0ACB8XR80_ARCLA|nr:hypothetical protein L6452_38623 [Arctium lappa]